MVHPRCVSHWPRSTSAPRCMASRPCRERQGARSDQAFRRVRSVNRLIWDFLVFGRQEPARARADPPRPRAEDAKGMRPMTHGAPSLCVVGTGRCSLRAANAAKEFFAGRVTNGCVRRAAPATSPVLYLFKIAPESAATAPASIASLFTFIQSSAVRQVARRHGPALRVDRPVARCVLGAATSTASASRARRLAS